MNLLRPVLRWAVVILSASFFGWGLLRFGATEPEVLYRLSLGLMVLVAVSVAGLFPSAFAETRTWLSVHSVGILLAGGVALSGAVQTPAILVPFVGWSAFVLASTFSGPTASRAWGVVIFLVLVGVVQAAYGLTQAIGGVDYIGTYYRDLGPVATGSLFNRNHYGGLMNMLLLLTLGGVYRAYTGQQRRIRSESLARTWLLTLCCGFLGLAILLSVSRGAAMSLVLSLGLATILIVAKRKRSRRAHMRMWPLGLVPAVIILLGLATGLDGLMARFAGGGAQLGQRGQVYQDTVSMILDNPLGVGPGMYQWRFRAYQTVEGRLWYDYAHNDYLQIIAEWGIPIGVLFWGVVLWMFARSVVVFLQAEESSVAGLGLGCALAIFSILIHSFVDFNLHIPANLMVFGVILSLSCGAVRALETQTTTSGSHR